MAEEPKNIRLNKAAKEFNVGITSLVEFLAKKGHQVEMNPNTRTNHPGSVLPCGIFVFMFEKITVSIRHNMNMDVVSSSFKK